MSGDPSALRLDRDCCCRAVTGVNPITSCDKNCDDRTDSIVSIQNTGVRRYVVWVERKWRMRGKARKAAGRGVH
jgi:hypothetical protein